MQRTQGMRDEYMLGLQSLGGASNGRRLVGGAWGGVHSLRSLPPPHVPIWLLIAAIQFNLAWPTAEEVSARARHNRPCSPQLTEAFTAPRAARCPRICAPSTSKAPPRQGLPFV